MINAANNIGNKFNEDGTVRFFPGNTIISFVDHSAPIWDHFVAIRSMLTCRQASHCLTLLPDSSIHMTVFEGVCHQWRKPEVWTNKLPLDCKLEETDDLFEQAFKTVKPLGQVNMRVDHVQIGLHGSGVQLQPATEADAAELKRFREECSAALGLRFPNHDTYEYHLSIGYFTKQPTAEEEKELNDYVDHANQYVSAKNIVFTIQQPQLTFFDNMFQFNPFRIPRKGL